MNECMLPAFEQIPPEAVAIWLVFFASFLLFTLAISILMAVVYCKICSKAGYNWALGLLMFVPIANIVLPLILAFSEWPIQKELQAFQRG
jgi:hypothetical protein